MARCTTTRSAAGHGLSAIRRASETRDGEAGFSLIESVVALTIFAVVAASATLWLVKTIQLTSTNRGRNAAIAIAGQQLEKIREERNSGRELDSGTAAVALQSASYTVTTTLNPAFNADCATGSTREVSVSVTWPGATIPIRVDSELAC